MRRPPDDEIRQLHEDVKRRQYYPKRPQPIAEAMSALLAQRGYANVEAAGQRDGVWQTVVGDSMAQYSRLGNIRRGILEIMVSNSAVLQELTCQKQQLLDKIVVALPDQKIRDLRFRIGVVK
jgi:predicted nucleic acid-binding Zn ribbon protein